MRITGRGAFQVWPGAGKPTLLVERNVDMHPERSQIMQLLRRPGPRNVPPLVSPLVVEVPYA
eukprot:3628392-Pyramimonas_sp.AAC.1